MNKVVDAIQELSRISNKDYVKIVDKTYSVPLSEIVINNEKQYVPNTNEKDSSLTAEYLLNLIKHKKSIVVLSNEITIAIKEDNGIQYWSDLYAIDSTFLNRKVSTMISGITQDSKSGPAGNLSMAYLTPYLNPLCVSFFANKGLSENSKILSTTQYDLINQTTPILYFEKEGDNEFVYQIDLNKVGHDEIDNVTSQLLVAGYRPIRIAFKNISPEQAVIFNLKPINTYLRDTIYKKEVEKFLGKKRGELVTMSSKDLARQGINIKDILSSKFSNKRFYCLLNNEKEVTDIFLVKQKFIYFPYSNKIERKPSFNDSSFANQKLAVNAGVYYIKRKTVVSEEDISVEELDIIDILKKNNYKDINKLNKTNPRPIDMYQFIIHDEQEKITQIIESNMMKSCFFSDAFGDEDIKTNLRKMSVLPDSSFKLSKIKISQSRIEDIQVTFEGLSTSGVKMYLYDRYHLIPVTNEQQGLAYVRTHKENLSFEREKVLTVMFIDNMIKKLKQEGHSDIEIYLELKVDVLNLEELTKPQNGYLDCIVSSKNAGIKYGKAYEFKAWATMSLFEEESLRMQCAKYQVTDFLVKSLGCTATYDNSSISDVQGVNLGIENLTKSSIFNDIYFSDKGILNNVKQLKLF